MTEAAPPAQRPSKRDANSASTQGQWEEYLQDGSLAWWPAYLASTLTGWTLNAITQCFCDKCKCHFNGHMAVLQHLRDSRKHLATVESLEAKCALYAHECTQMSQWGYGVDAGGSLGLDGDDITAQQQTVPEPGAGPSSAAAAGVSSEDGSSSPSHNWAAPELFTASSEAASSESPPPQQRNRRGRNHATAATATAPAPEAYDAAFPALGGPAMSSVPARKWTPAAATRKLRFDAPEWCPGAPTASFALLTVKAKQAAEAAKAAAVAAAAAQETQAADSTEAQPESAAAPAPAAKQRSTRRGKNARASPTSEHQAAPGVENPVSQLPATTTQNTPWRNIVTGLQQASSVQA